MRTRLSKEVLATLNTEDTVAVYTGLTFMMEQMLTELRDVIEVTVCPEIIYYQLTGGYEVPRKTKTKIEDGIIGLAEAGYIKILNSNKGFYTLDLKPMELDIKDKEGNISTKDYTFMDREEIWNIMGIDFKQKFNLLRLAIAVFGTFNMDKTQLCYKCGFSSMETLMELSHIKGRETAFNIFKALEDNNIIYVRHSDRYSTSGETVKNVSNVYSRPCDKAYADNYYEDRFNKKSDDRSAREVCKEYKDKQEKTMEKPEVEKPKTVPQQKHEETCGECLVDKFIAEEEEVKTKLNEKLKLTENTTPESEPAEEAVTTGITEEPKNKLNEETKVDNDDIFSDVSFSSQYEETSKVKKVNVTKDRRVTGGQTPVGMPPRRPAGFVDETLKTDAKDKNEVAKKSLTHSDAQKEALRKLGIIPDEDKPKMTKEEIMNSWEDDEIEDIDEEMACFEG